LDNPIIWQIFLQIILIALNAVFACAEIAVISMNDNKLAKMASQGDKRAVRLARLTSQPARFLATIQVAITLSGFLGSAFAADNFASVIVDGLIKLGVKIPVSTLNTISVIIITLILSYFTLVFGELVPKRVAMKKAESLALGLSALVSFISKVFAPLVWLLTISTNFLLRLFGIDPNSEDDEVTEEEIRMMVDVGSEKGTIDKAEKEIIQNVFEFDDITVGDIVTHRTEVSLLWMDETTEQWEQTIHDSRHTIYPICNESVDDVVGLLNAKDYFRLKDKTRENIMKNCVKPVYFVPESLRADVLFRNMKTSSNHFAVVLDEYGGVSGIVTMNDLVQQLVGDFDDEVVVNEEMEIERIDSKTWKILGSASLEEVSKQIGVELPVEEYDTFGGYVFRTLGSIPEDGSKFQLESEGLLIKVVEIKNHRLHKAIVCLT
jgi:putative hemolysin